MTINNKRFPEVQAQTVHTPPDYCSTHLPLSHSNLRSNKLTKVIQLKLRPQPLITSDHKRRWYLTRTLQQTETLVTLLKYFKLITSVENKHKYFEKFLYPSHDNRIHLTFPGKFNWTTSFLELLIGLTNYKSFIETLWNPKKQYPPPKPN